MTKIAVLFGKFVAFAYSHSHAGLTMSVPVPVPKCTIFIPISARFL